MKGKAWLYALALSLALAIGAGAEGHTLGDTGLRLYVPQDWQVLTAQNAAQYEEALAAQGSNSAAVLADLESRGAAALIYGPQLQAWLVRLPGCGVDSVWSADQAGRTAIEGAAKAAYPHLAGSWQNDAWLCLKGSEMLGHMPAYHQVWVTCHYGSLYAVEAVRYGAEFTPEQNQQLLTLTSDLVVLGAAQPEETVQIPALVLPENRGAAEIRISRDETPITLDNPYTEVTGTYVLTGTTTPNADLRYYVDGAGVARFKSDAEGRFSVEITHLSKGKNTIRVQSISDKGYGVVLFTLNYTPATTPVVLAQLPKKVAAETYAVAGRALPGTQVTLLRGSRSMGTVTVGEDGLFTLTASLEKKKAYDFTLRAEHNDYRRTDLKFSLTRTASQLEQAVPVDAQQALKRPGDFQNVLTELTGSLTRMGNSPATGPYMIINDQFIVRCEHLLGLTEGPVKALVRLTGQAADGLIAAELITLY